MRARSALAVCLSFACVAAGCGADRPAPPSAVVPADAPLRIHRFPTAGMAIGIPIDTAVERRRRPALFSAVRSDWFVSGFAFRRREPLPRGRRRLRDARRRLVGELRRRNRTFRLVSARVTRVAGAPAVDVLGDQALSRRRLRTRSVHVYEGRVEYVIELAAPRRRFTALDRGVFERMLRSLRVTGRAR